MECVIVCERERETETELMMKTKITEMRKKYIGWNEDKLNITEEKYSEFEDIAIESIQNGV